ncbi:hypothetical protein Tco_1302385 [Tanacetum coccineum]
MFGDHAVSEISSVVLGVVESGKCAMSKHEVKPKLLLKKKRKVGVGKLQERNRIAEEKATNEALIKTLMILRQALGRHYLAEKLQEQEREQFTIEERAKFLHDTIAAQRKFLAQQRTEAIRNRPQQESL